LYSLPARGGSPWPLCMLRCSAAAGPGKPLPCRWPGGRPDAGTAEKTEDITMKGSNHARQRNRRGAASKHRGGKHHKGGNRPQGNPIRQQLVCCRSAARRRQRRDLLRLLSMPLIGLTARRRPMLGLYMEPVLRRQGGREAGRACGQCVGASSLLARDAQGPRPAMALWLLACLCSLSSLAELVSESRP